MKSVKIVLGLGNPGPEYATSRHNFGARALQLACKRRGLQLIPSLSSRSLLAEERQGLDVVAFAFPQTYMNDSGAALRGLLRRYHITSPADLIVLHDELDLPPGVVRIKAGGGSAGHNGLKSIVVHLGSSSFTRVRIGIGRPTGSQSVTDYVLARLTQRQLEPFEAEFESAADALDLILAKGVEAAMNEFNGR